MVMLLPGLCLVWSEERDPNSDNHALGTVFVTQPGLQNRLESAQISFLFNNIPSTIIEQMNKYKLTERG